jgi:hypothetical protein
MAALPYGVGDLAGFRPVRISRKLASALRAKAPSWPVGTAARPSEGATTIIGCPKSGRAVVLTQTIRFDPAGYLRILGLAPADRTEVAKARQRLAGEGAFLAGGHGGAAERGRDDDHRLHAVGIARRRSRRSRSARPAASPTRWRPCPTASATSRASARHLNGDEAGGGPAPHHRDPLGVGEAVGRLAAAQILIAEMPAEAYGPLVEKFTPEALRATGFEAREAGMPPGGGTRPTEPAGGNAASAASARDAEAIRPRAARARSGSPATPSCSAASRPAEPRRIP